MFRRCQIGRAFHSLRVALAVLVLLIGGSASALAATYTDNGNGTVTDPTTGLTWMRCAMGQTWTGSGCSGTAGNYYWDDAMALTGTVSFAGQSDWRLPSLLELQSIINIYGSPAIDSAAFPATPGAGFWSSSSIFTGSFSAWYVHFNSGSTGSYDKQVSFFFARLVSGGQYLGSFPLTVSRTGSGSVSSTPAGIACGSTCNASFGTNVTLTATPPAGSLFSGWSGACSNTSGTCTVMMDAAKSVTATFTSPPAAPTSVVAQSSNAQASVTFSTPSSTGGAAIVYYTVTASPGGQTITGSASPLVVTGLTNGTSYTFTVTATNSVGTSIASSVSNAATPVGLPTAPGNVTALAGNGQATISFAQSTDNGGSAITYYTATATPGGRSAFGSASPLIVTGLTNGSSYTFTVTATSSVGTGSPSSTSNAVTPLVPLTSISLGQASLTIGTSTSITPTPSTGTLGACTSSNTGVATVSGPTILGVGAGTSIITCGNVSATLTVQAPVLTGISLSQSAVTIGSSTSISPSPTSAALGTCTSSSSNIAVVNGNSVTALAVGTTTLTCGGFSTSLTVTAPTLASISLTSVNIYQGSTTTVLPAPSGAVLGTCTSSNSGMASVSGNIVTGVSPGSATITCTGYTTSLTILAPLLTGISVSSSSIAIGSNATILPNPTGAILPTCTSSSNAIVTVSGATVQGIALGTATISCGSYTTSLTIKPLVLAGVSLSLSSVSVGSATTLLPNPAGVSLGSCSSSNPTIATVSGDTATAVSVGTATLQCGAFTTALTVTPPPLTGVTLTAPSLTAGTTTTINPLPTQALLGTCTSGNTTIATVIGSQVRALSAGSTVVNCGNVSAAITVMASDAVLTDLLLNCPVMITSGQSDSCTTMAIYSNSTIKTIEATWSSDNSALTIDKAGAIGTTFVTSTVWAYVTATYTEGQVTRTKRTAVQLVASPLGACSGTNPYTMLLTINGKVATTPTTLKANDPVDIQFCMANFDGHTLLDVYVAAVIPGPNGAPPTWFIASQSAVFNTIQWNPWDLVGDPGKFMAKQAIQSQSTLPILKFNIPVTLPHGVTTVYAQAVLAGRRLLDVANWSTSWAPATAAFDYAP